MNFTVLWMPIAEARLADIWTTAVDRNRITRAAHLIDQTLQSAPEEAGESRSENQRVIFEPPLGALFTVSLDDRTVSVLSVWRTDPRR
jgi:hypothetical protein